MPPPILLALFLVIGIGTAYDLPGALVHGKDPQVELKTFRSTDEYRVSVEPTLPRNGQCRGTMIALASTGGRPTRMRIDGEEQLLDTSWSRSYLLNPGEEVEHRYEFIDPVGGAPLACRVATARCERGAHGPESYTGYGLCYDDVAPPTLDPRRTGAPRLEVHAAHHAMIEGLLPGGQLYGSFEVVAEVLGHPTEEWYCPEVEWRTPIYPGSPDYTSSTAESDCEPYTPELALSVPRRWTRRFTLVEGEWLITIVLSKAGRQISLGTVSVTVGSPYTPYTAW